jgi:hypothetical protein
MIFGASLLDPADAIECDHVAMSQASFTYNVSRMFDMNQLRISAKLTSPFGPS